jgi:hypothetical protein
MVSLLELQLEMRRKGDDFAWKCGWYFEHDEGDWGGPFATKAEAYTALNAAALNTAAFIAALTRLEAGD